MSILKKVNMQNISHEINTFNKIIREFGDSMGKMTRELSSDIEKSNRESKVRAKKNQENLDRIWGKSD
jgi:hypothetical protein